MSHLLILLIDLQYFFSVYISFAICINSLFTILHSNTGTLISGLIGCETYSLAYQIEQYPGMVILTSRQEAGLLDIARVPHLRYDTERGRSVL